MKSTSIRLIDRALYVGPPGVGKTEIVMQKAKEEAEKFGKIFVDLREADEKTTENIFAHPEKYYLYYRLIAPHVYPEELSYPEKRTANGTDRAFVDYVPPRVILAMTAKDIHGVLFIDELSNVQRDDQMSMFYSIIQEKEAAWTIKLSRNIKIVMASNNAEWSEIARALPKPLRNRCKIYTVSAPSIDEWKDYMVRQYGDAWEKLCYAYLKTYPFDFIKPPAEDDGFTNFPTPRSWTSLAVLLHELKGQCDDEFIEETVIGHLGKEVGVKFAALLKTKIDIPAVLEKLRKSPEDFEKLSTNDKILISDAIAQLGGKTLAEEYSGLLKYMGEKSREFLVLILVMMPKQERLELLRRMQSMAKDVIKVLSSYTA